MLLTLVRHYGKMQIQLITEYWQFKHSLGMLYWLHMPIISISKLD